MNDDYVEFIFEKIERKDLFFGRPVLAHIGGFVFLPALYYTQFAYCKTCSFKDVIFKNYN